MKQYYDSEWIKWKQLAFWGIFFSMSCVFHFNAKAQIIISQYYEGSSFNKWIEITNIGTETVNLESPQLYLALYTNANADAPSGISPNNNQLLTGNLASGATLLFKNSNAALPNYASGTSSSTINFNGDDLIILTTSNSTTAYDDRIDIVGDGSSWGGDKSLYRNSSVLQANSTFTLSEWTEVTNATVDGAQNNETEYLGFHSYAAPTTTTIDNAGSPSTGDITQNTSDAILFGFSLTPSSGSIDFTAVDIATSGTATTSDLNNFRIIHDANGNGAFDGGETVVQTISTLDNPLSFGTFATAQTGLSAQTYYLLVADVASGATIGSTFTASIAAATDVTSTGNESGTATGNTQTVISASAPLITVTASLNNFGNVAATTNSTSQNYSVEGSNLTDDITITAPTGFEVSTDDAAFSSSVNLTQSGGTVGSTTIYTRFSPSTGNGANSGNITHTSTGATSQNIAVEGFALDSEPTTAATNVGFANVAATSLDVTWTRGNGDSVLVLMKSGSAVDFDPVDGTPYVANASFGSGTELGTGNYLVYSGTGTSASVTNLSGSTTYHVEVIEFNAESTDNTQNYNVGSTLVGSQVTTTPPALNFLLGEDFTGSTFSGNWSGDNLDYSILTDGTFPSGTASTDGHFLASNQSVGNSIYLANTNEVLSWKFSLGGGSFSPSGANQFGVILMSDVAITGDIDVASFNGYYLLVGNNNAPDPIQLMKSTGSTKTKIGDFPTSPDYSGSITAGIDVLVTRSSTGVFELFYNEGFTYDSDPKTSAGTLSDSDHSSSSYFGIFTAFANTSAERRIFIDNIKLGDLVVTGAEGWRMMSSPVTSAQYSNLLGNIWTQGIAQNANTTAGDPSVMTYNGTAYVGISDLNATMTPGQGFITFVYSDDDYTNSAANAGFPKILSVSGTENTGSLSLSTSSTPALNGGNNTFTLLGNPYAATLDWDNVDTSEVYGTIYVYDHAYTSSGVPNQSNATGGGFRAWNGTAGDLSGGLISPFQGFYVQARGASPTITIEEADKVNDASTFYKEVTSAPVIKLQGVMNETLVSNAYLSFTESGKVGIDSRDAYKLFPLDEVAFLALGTEADDFMLDINNLPVDLEEAIEIPLMVRGWDYKEGNWISTGGAIELSWPELSNIPENWVVQLVDNQTQTVIDLTQETSYRFSIDAISGKMAAKKKDLSPTPQLAEAEEARMKLVLGPISTSNEDIAVLPTEIKLGQNYPNPFNPSTQIGFVLPEANEVRLSVFDMLGREIDVLVSGTKSAGAHNAVWNATMQSSGIYYYRLQVGSHVLTRKMTLIK